jgi:chorismate synthase
VQIGLGVASADRPGSAQHDIILPGGKRGSNNAGGMEGGVSNGEALTVTCTMKPIPTLIKGLASIDIRDGSAQNARYERSDYCAVPAASVVGEAMLMIAIAKAILDSFPVPHMEALKTAFEQHRSRV